MITPAQPAVSDDRPRAPARERPQLGNRFVDRATGPRQLDCGAGQAPSQNPVGSGLRRPKDTWTGSLPEPVMLPWISRRGGEGLPILGHPLNDAA
jgi:hypothetical protein